MASEDKDRAGLMGIKGPPGPETEDEKTHDGFKTWIQRWMEVDALSLWQAKQMPMLPPGMLPPPEDYDVAYEHHSKPYDYQLTSDEFRELRKHIGLTQKEMANLMGVAVTTLQAWEGAISGTRAVAKPNYLACMVLTMMAEGFLPRGTPAKANVRLSPLARVKRSQYSSALMDNLYDELEDAARNARDLRRTLDMVRDQLDRDESKD